MTTPAAPADPQRLEGYVRDLLPLLLRNEAFLEELHLQAVQLEREDKTEAAGRLYRLVQGQADAFPRLRSWAFFKEAEQHVRAGRPAEARALLQRVLALHPGHAKARLLLHDAADRLTVGVGSQPDWPWPGIFVAFNCFDLRLWDYYFGHRPVDALWILPPLLAVSLGPDVLGPALKRHLAADGAVVFALHPGRKLAIGRAELLDLLSGDAPRFETLLRDRLAALQAD